MQTLVVHHARMSTIHEDIQRVRQTPGHRYPARCLDAIHLWRSRRWSRITYSVVGRSRSSISSNSAGCSPRHVRDTRQENSTKFYCRAVKIKKTIPSTHENWEGILEPNFLPVTRWLNFIMQAITMSCMLVAAELYRDLQRQDNDTPVDSLVHPPHNNCNYGNNTFDNNYLSMNTITTVNNDF